MRALRASAPIVLAAALVLAACGGSTPVRTADASLTFSTTDVKSITYNTALVPAGATAKVTSESGGGKSTVTLEVSGLLPDHHYGAHAHTKVCGAKPADSGPHFQHEADPVTPSVDPKYANAQNEIWLDLTTDGSGKATSTSTVAWDLTDAAHPASVVIHANHTSTDPGKAGTAGDRLACVDVAF